MPSSPFSLRLVLAAATTMAVTAGGTAAVLAAMRSEGTGSVPLGDTPTGTLAAGTLTTGTLTAGTDRISLAAWQWAPGPDLKAPDLSSPAAPDTTSTTSRAAAPSSPAPAPAPAPAATPARPSAPSRADAPGRAAAVPRPRPVRTGTTRGGLRALGRELAAEYGWQGDQFSCLDLLWTKESGWNPGARNPSSGAYGIPQSLPAGKMAAAGPDWRTNPSTQIRWGLTYVRDVYGTPCSAWSHSVRTDWY